MSRSGSTASATERDDRALGAAADRPRDVQRGAGRRAAGEDEPPQRRQLRLERVDPAFEPGDVLVRDRCLRHAAGDPMRGIGEPRAEREQIALDPLQHRQSSSASQAGRAARPSHALSSSTSPYAATRGSDLARACRRRAPSPRCRRSWCRFSLERLSYQASPGIPHVMPPRTKTRAGARRQPRPRRCRPGRRQRFRRRLLDWYRTQRPRPAVAADQRPVPHPRVRGDAAADAGRSRAAEVRTSGSTKYPSLEALADAPTKRTSRRPGVRSATTSGPGGSTRSRASRSRATAAQLPSDEATLLSFKGIGAYTAGAVRASRSASARPSSTPTSRACSSASSSAAATRRRTRCSRHLWSVSRTVLPHAARVRLQPGADGFRRHALHGAQAEVPALPDARRCARLPVQSRERAPP